MQVQVARRFSLRVVWYKGRALAFLYRRKAASAANGLSAFGGLGAAASGARLRGLAINGGLGGPY